MKFNLKRALTLTMVAITMFILVACQTTQYTVAFDSHGGSAVASSTVAEGAKIDKPSDASRGGYTFDGWSKESQYAEE